MKSISRYITKLQNPTTFAFANWSNLPDWTNSTGLKMHGPFALSHGRLINCQAGGPNPMVNADFVSLYLCVKNKLQINRAMEVKND